MNTNAFGRYQIIRPLGGGGMADVYLARDPVLDREVAIKMPNMERLSPEVMARFKAEAKAVARLEHPAIVSLYDYGDQDGHHYLVMRYLPGGSLADRIAQRSLKLNEALGIIERIASALDYAHSQGVLHRDVKPGNILFDERGAAYLSDFGIARSMNPDSGESLTKTGLVVGTVAYMSPEQILGKPLDGRCDIYSLGVVIFEMLAGDMPYKADSTFQQAMQHVNAPIPKLWERRRDLPPNTQIVIDRVLAKEPTRRYQTSSMLSQDLRQIVGGYGPAAPRRLQAARNILWPIAGVIILALLLFALLRPSPGSPAVGAVTPVFSATAHAPSPTLASSSTTNVEISLPPTSTPASVIQVSLTHTVASPVNPTTEPADVTTTVTSNLTPTGDALPFFMTRPLTLADLEGLSTWELDRMRNEIFARHGRGFNRTDLQDYFDQQPWYTRTYDPEEFPTDLLLTEVQKDNAALILTYQE